MLNHTHQRRALFEKVQFEMRSNDDLIDYKLKHLNHVDDLFINHFSNRLMTIVNELDAHVY